MPESNLPKRKPLRLADFDYSLPRIYHVVFCCYERNQWLGEMTNGSLHLSQIGKILEQTIAGLPQSFPLCEVEHYVIMPNHVHLLIRLEDDDNKSPDEQVKLGTIVAALKAKVAQAVRRKGGNARIRIWQRGYYDTIIRNSAHYSAAWEYIENNPINWDQDPENR